MIKKLQENIKNLEQKTNATLSLLVQQKNDSQAGHDSPYIDQLYNLEQKKRQDLTNLKRLFQTLKVSLPLPVIQKQTTTQP
jgi:hypothetical protein